MMAEETSKEPEREEKRERKFSQEQYEMLLRCQDKEDMKEWNKWRLKNPKQDVLLEGADFSFFYLQNAHLNQLGQYDDQKGKWLEIKNKVYMKGAHCESAQMKSANLSWADLENANFRETRLDNSRLHGARLKDTIGWSAYFQGTNLRDAILEGADLQGAHLEGACISGANLESANFHLAHVDSSTLIWACKVGRKTNLSGVALDIAQIDPETKQLLQYNIRRKNWEEWYKEHTRLKWLVQSFWWMSDYGLQTWRIIVTFFGLALIFALAYWLWPSCVMANDKIGDIRGLWHALYFSVVTMTTLGFGDIAANPDSWGGQTLLMLQVILGYVLLGALVTRFAVLFTAGGPAGKFAGESKRDSGASKK